jgi:hypothetical protein
MMGLKMDIKEHLDDMSDKELIAACEEVKADLSKAAYDNPGSEWHQACFAAALLYCEELSERGIRLGTVH